MIQIQFEGYINKVREYDWGVVYDVAHSQRKKQADGTWANDGYDYFSVVGERGFAENDFVAIKGKLKTKRYEKKDGGSGLALNVRADSMEKTGYGSGREALASVPEMQEIWPAIKEVPADNAPF